MKTRLKALAAAAALFVLPYFLLTLWFSWSNKDVVYLRGDGSTWMLNPEDQPVVNGFPNDLPAMYSIFIDLAAPPQKGILKLMAVKSHELTVNGVRLSTLEGTEAKNWKFPAVYDITRDLKPGGNLITVLVRSPYSKAALRAEGSVTSTGGTAVSLDSGVQWAVASAMVEPDMGITGRPNPPVFITHPSFRDKMMRGEYWPGSFYIFGAAGGLIFIMLLFPGMTLRLDRVIALPSPGILYRLSVAVVFAALAYTLYNNFMVYPAVRTGDFDGHLNYFNRMLESFSPPLASEGFQMYNPPLYYFVSALAFRVFGPAGTLSDVIRYAQLVNTASTFFSVVLLFLILRRVFSGRLVVVLSLSVVAFLPMCLVKAPSVSGDSTLTLLCTLTFYLWQRYSESRSRAFAALAGLAAGLCFLTRYTGLFMILGISAGFLYIAVRDRSSRRRALMDMCLYVSLAFAVSGWYYARNLMVFHHLFPINGTPEMFFFRQFPGYRDWSFYANVKALFINSPFNKDNIIESFPAGTYTTFWADGQRLFLGTWDPVPSIVALALSLMPTLLIIYGVFRGLSGMVSNGRDSRTIFLMGCILTLSMSLAAYALGTYSYPYYSMVKSFYVMFCIVPFICLLALGLEAWTARSGHITAVLWLASACALQMSIFLL